MMVTNHKIKLICFDLDGVLVDACDLHKKSLEGAMQCILGTIISEEQHKTTFNGLPTKKKLEMLGVEEPKIKIINKLKQEITKFLINNNLKLDEEKINIGSFLKSKQIKICVVTNSIRETTELMLSKIGFKTFVDLIISNEDVKLPKPDPEGYNNAMKLFNVHPEETIIIEDSKYGILAAKASGAKVIEVKDTSEVTLDNLIKFL